MRRLLLVSSSNVHGSRYLEHCEARIKQLFSAVDRVLFVPYAVFDRAGYAGHVRKRFAEMGLELQSVHEAADPGAAVTGAAGLFVGGGNTFRLLKTLQDNGLIELIRRRVHEGMPYMGSSAGSNIAGPTIRTTNDMPIVYPATFDALDLVPFQINPHYLGPNRGSTHKGESRDQRIREFHEESPVAVMAILEGAMLVVEDDSMRLEGNSGGKLFRRGQDPQEYGDGADLDFLLDPGQSPKT